MPRSAMRSRSWLRWVAEALLLSDALLLAVVGIYLYATAPDTETLGQGYAGMLLIAGAVALAFVGLLGLGLPGVAATVLLIVGVPILVTFLRAELGPADEPDEQLSTTSLLVIGAVLATPVVGGLLLAIVSLARLFTGTSGTAASTRASPSGH